ncbi:Pectinesterase [Zea mays]|uniref:pectinesterase n=1 Tax=Zea mays TaxID=4577 RepID=A0A1D6E3V6_MAIZE|nr:Pectinesterase [Zea mays]
MARILVLALLTIASLLLPPVVASQQAAAKCEYRKHSGHRYRHPVGVRKIVVDAGGAGDFVSIQRAVDSVPEGNTVRVIVQINAGTYIEKVVVPASKPYVTFQGAGRDVTVVEWHDRASDRGPDGQPLRTYNTASVTILANYFNAKNISFKEGRRWRSATATSRAPSTSSSATPAPSTRTASCTRRRSGSARWRRTGGATRASAPASPSSTAG